MQPKDIGRVSFDDFDSIPGLPNLSNPVDSFSSQDKEPDRLMDKDAYTKENISERENMGEGGGAGENPQNEDYKQEQSGWGGGPNLRRLLSYSRKSKLIGLFFILSLCSHFFILKAIYRLSPAQAKEKSSTIMQKVDKVALKMPSLENDQVKKPEKADIAEPKTKHKPTAPAQKKSKSTKPKINSPKKERVKIAKKLSSKELVALGRKHIGKMKEGRFPSLILNYSDPYTYMRQLYALGAKTLIYDINGRDLFEINLFSEEALPFNKGELEGFSPFKRVVEDAQWDKQKNQVASRLNTSPEYLKILLLIPSSLEMRWLGHLVSLFQQMDLLISEVTTVEALFQKARLKVERVYLSDGSSREIDDPIGA